MVLFLFVTWEQRKLGEVGKAQSGIGFPDREQGGKDGVPFYKVSDMNNYGNEHEMYSANNYVTEEQCRRNGWTPITEISVIFAKVGAAIMLNRKRLVRFSFLLDNNTMAYKFGSDWNIDFGKTLFERIDLTELVQIGALPSYNATDIESLEISMPDKPEQYQIGKFFRQLDNLITLHQCKDFALDTNKAFQQRCLLSIKSANAWEQREFNSIAKRITEMTDTEDLPRVEYEDIVSGQGTLNKDINKKKSCKTGILFDNGDVLFGKLRPYLKNWLFATFMGIAVGDFWVLRANNADGLYIYTLLQIDAFQDIANQSTGTKMPRADWSLVSKQRFLTPTVVPEQRKIGEFFKQLDNLITLHQRKQTIKKRSKMDEKRRVNYLMIANAWEQRKAKTLFISYAEKGYPELPVLSATQDKGMVYRDDTGKNIFHDKNNEISYKRVQPGQFVIHLRSFQGGFAHSNILGITSPAYTIFGFKDDEKQCDLYWKYVFCSSEFVKRLETVTYGIRDGRSISYDEFLIMKFIVPKYEEQVQIASILIEIDNLITLHQRGLIKIQGDKKWQKRKFQKNCSAIILNAG